MYKSNNNMNYSGSRENNRLENPENVPRRSCSKENLSKQHRSAQESKLPISFTPPPVVFDEEEEQDPFLTNDEYEQEQEKICKQRYSCNRLDEILLDSMREEIQKTAEVVFENLKIDLNHHLDYRLIEIESSWSKNPYMHVFDEMKRYEKSSAVENTESDQRSYRALVQQIAYDFRRCFFSEWSHELRSQRPFMNSIQRNMLQQMVSDRFQYFEDTMSAQVQELQRQNQVLKAELTNLRYMVMRQDVERLENNTPLQQNYCTPGLPPKYSPSPSTTPPPILNSINPTEGSNKNKSHSPPHYDLLEDWDALKRNCFDK